MIRAKSTSLRWPFLQHYYASRRLSYTRTSFRRVASRDSPRPRIVAPSKIRVITDDILTPIKGIHHEDLKSMSSNIENFAPLASYDWFAHPTPTIAVPGSLPTWDDSQLPLRIGRDSTLEFVDENILRSPLSPLAPLVASVQYWSPSFDLSKVDIVTDRNNLSKLIQWITTGPNNCKDFRIDIDVSGQNTILFTRWEGRTHFPIGNGYSETFKWATTISESARRDRFGYFRVVTYDFAGLKLLVRHEVDARLPFEGDAKTMAYTPASIDEKPNAVNHPHLNILRRGHDLVSQSRLVELKTRSTISVDTIDWSDIYSRLYLSQSPYLYFGIHDHGFFTRVQKKALDNKSDPDMAQASQEAERGLRRLGSVLHILRKQILDAGLASRTIGNGHGLAVLCERGELALYERTSKGLPQELLHAFD